MCDGKYPRVKRVDGNYGCTGCFLYTHHKDQFGECYYCNKLFGAAIDCYRQFVQFTYPVIEDPNVKSNDFCPLPERWKQVSNVEVGG